MQQGAACLLANIIRQACPHHPPAAGAPSSTSPLPQVCLLTNPIWLIKTRMQLQSKAAAAAGAVPYKGLWDALVQIGRTEGLRGYYKGLGPSLVLVGAAPGTRLELACTELACSELSCRPWGRTFCWGAAPGLD